MTRQEAIRRSKLRRYLTLMNYQLPEDSTTEVMMFVVQGLHRQRHKQYKLNNAWPISGAKLEVIAKESFYVNQLVCMKRMFGLNSDIGVILEDGKNVQCHTVGDLIEHGLASPKFAYLDAHMSTLEVMKFKEWSNPYLK